MHRRWRGRAHGRPSARCRRGRRGGRGGGGAGLGGLLAPGQGCRHQKKRAETSHEINSSQGLLVVGFVGRFVAGFVGRLVAGLARREIVEVDGGVLVLAFIAERVVDAVVGLRANRALGAALRGALVYVLLLALGRRVGT